MIGKHVAGLPNRFVALFLRKKWYFIGGFFLLLLAFSFAAYLKSAVVIVLLTLVASFSTYYKKYIKFTLGFELVTFSTVICTILYGPVVGAIVGFVSSTAAEVIPQLIDPSSFFWILSLPVAAFVISFFHGMGVPVFWLGMISIVVQFVISEPMRLFSGDEYLKTMGVVNIVSTAAWTVVWFRLLAPPVIAVLS